MSEENNTDDIILSLFNDIQNTLLAQNDVEQPVRTIPPCPKPEIFNTVLATPIIVCCIICQTNQIQTVNIPCMHASFCGVCANDAVQNSSKCPDCRGELTNIAPLYLSYTNVESNTKKCKIES